VAKVAVLSLFSIGIGLGSNPLEVLTLLTFAHNYIKSSHLFKNPKKLQLFV
jgi:hypothetical protein